MSALVCSNCGGVTNSAVCDWRIGDNGAVCDECYLKVENGIWVKGCGYNDCDQWTRPSIDRMLGEPVAIFDDKIDLEEGESDEGD